MFRDPREDFGDVLGVAVLQLVLIIAEHLVVLYQRYQIKLTSSYACTIKIHLLLILAFHCIYTILLDGLLCHLSCSTLVLFWFCLVIPLALDCLCGFFACQFMPKFLPVLTACWLPNSTTW